VSRWPQMIRGFLTFVRIALGGVWLCAGPLKHGHPPDDHHRSALSRSSGRWTWRTWHREVAEARDTTAKRARW